jgi:hypothetical protein
MLKASFNNATETLPKCLSEAITFAEIHCVIHNGAASLLGGNYFEAGIIKIPSGLMIFCGNGTNKEPNKV